jgi:hypothetical protein
LAKERFSKLDFVYVAKTTNTLPGWATPAMIEDGFMHRCAIPEEPRSATQWNAAS